MLDARRSGGVYFVPKTANGIVVIDKRLLVQ
jgi:hypothetical protein